MDDDGLVRQVMKMLSHPAPPPGVRADGGGWGGRGRNERQQKESKGKPVKKARKDGDVKKKPMFDLDSFFSGKAAGGTDLSDDDTWSPQRLQAADLLNFEEDMEPFVNFLNVDMEREVTKRKDTKGKAFKTHSKRAAEHIKTERGLGAEEIKKFRKNNHAEQEAIKEEAKLLAKKGSAYCQELRQAEEQAQDDLDAVDKAQDDLDAVDKETKAAREEMEAGVHTFITGLHKQCKKQHAKVKEVPRRHKREEGEREQTDTDKRKLAAKIVKRIHALA
ncbi:hypothetical protein T484DRAFT_1769874 [Baffinella frigidus]|nr:hypothetical protein T484DRAFT_1769874 [Cryptophyta sp. CCMP2293]